MIVRQRKKRHPIQPSIGTENKVNRIRNSPQYVTCQKKPMKAKAEESSDTVVTHVPTKQPRAGDRIRWLRTQAPASIVKAEKHDSAFPWQGAVGILGSALSSIEFQVARFTAAGGHECVGSFRVSITDVQILQSKTIEQRFQVKDLRQHVLERPDSYVGSVDKKTEVLFVPTADGERLERRSVTYVPALLKIFDEILCNATDSHLRNGSTTQLKVNFDRTHNRIVVYNNGKTLPVVQHETAKCLVPEFVFSHWLSGESFDDEEDRITAGRNGIGAKATVAYCTELMVECNDVSESKHHFRQVHRNNMQQRDPPIVTAAKGKTDYTRITFAPDWKRFDGMTGFDDDILALMQKRVWDVSGALRHVTVFLDGKKLPFHGAKEYAALHLPEDAKVEHVKISDAHEIAVAARPTDEDDFCHDSLVNCIWTPQCGTQTKFIADHICKYVETKAKKRPESKDLRLTAAQIKRQLFIFSSHRISKPTFNTQTKTELTLPVDKFQPPLQIPPAFLLRVLQKTDLLRQSVAAASSKTETKFAKGHAKKRRLIGIPKLEDAHCAGTAESDQCALLVCEGDSAKALAVAGLSVVGREHWGVFALKGKLLNVRGATHKQRQENEEVVSLCKILGLQPGRDYDKDGIQSLRYGKLVIMTDQDLDGSHIKGLVLNMIAVYAPTLFKRPGFLYEFITPIVRASRGKQQAVDFFTLPQFRDWFDAHRHERWKIKYYKGLGTSTLADAKHYFAHLDVHLKEFRHDGPMVDGLFELAFAKNMSDARKRWLQMPLDNVFLDQSQPVLALSEFVKKELVLYSDASNLRAIPSVVDGLTPGNRKILFTCFKRSSNAEIKVDQLR